MYIAQQRQHRRDRDRADGQCRHGQRHSDDGAFRYLNPDIQTWTLDSRDSTGTIGYRQTEKGYMDNTETDTETAAGHLDNIYVNRHGHRRDSPWTT